MNLNKKIGILVCALLLAIPFSPISPLKNKPLQNVKAGEQTLASKAEDPLAKYEETAQNQVALTESSNAPDDFQEPISATEEAPPQPSSSTNESVEEQALLDTAKNNQPEPDGVGPQAVYLREGNPGDDPSSYDIDATFAEIIRTKASSRRPSFTWSGHGKAANMLTDEDMANLTEVGVDLYNLTSLKGIEYAVNIVSLECNRNQLSELDVSNNTALSTLICGENRLSELDVSTIPGLSSLYCDKNQLSKLDVSNNPILTTFSCSDNQLSKLDVSSCTALGRFRCDKNQLSKLDVSNNTALTWLYCGSNQLSELDISNNTALTDLHCGNSSQLYKLDVSNHPALKNLFCYYSALSELDVSNCTALEDVSCFSSQLSKLDVSNCTALRYLECEGNQLSELDVSDCTALTSLNCHLNQLRDITSANGLTSLSHLSADSQKIRIPVPSVSSDGRAVIDVLRTTAHAGLSASNRNISPAPNFAYNGDEILLSNVTSQSLNEKSIDFSYDGSQLVEGAASYTTKRFGGTITFFTRSDLGNELKPVDKQKLYTEEEVEWEWTITSLTNVEAKDIQAKLNLPAGLEVDAGSIVVEKNGTPFGSISDLEVANNLGDLVQGEYITITFKTKASGNAEEWLEVTGYLDWKDDTIASPYNNQSKGSVQILDEEQTYTPKENSDLALLSTPILFNYGVQNIEATAKVHQLPAANYQTNTNVATKGFYTRVKDDRSFSTGWKLSASLSEFEDGNGVIMPNSSGTQLKFENLTIECITNRDTPQEAIEPSPTGVPSSVQTTGTLVAGQTAKTLISAQTGEGQGTWQLRMPFDKISLNLPANAGKQSTNYQAKLTWSLDNTP